MALSVLCRVVLSCLLVAHVTSGASHENRNDVELQRNLEAAIEDAYREEDGEEDLIHNEDAVLDLANDDDDNDEEVEDDDDEELMKGMDEEEENDGQNENAAVANVQDANYRVIGGGWARYLRRSPRSRIGSRVRRTAIVRSQRRVRRPPQVVSLPLPIRVVYSRRRRGGWGRRRRRRRRSWG